MKYNPQTLSFFTLSFFSPAQQHRRVWSPPPALHLLATGRFIVVNVDAFKLQVMVTAVSACWVDAVLIADDLPELPGKESVINISINEL